MEYQVPPLQREVERAFGQPLERLRQRVRSPGADPLLDVALGIFDHLAFAEHVLAAQKERLRELADPGHAIGDADVSHILDCAQRLAKAHTARTAHTTALTALLTAPASRTAPPPRRAAHPAPRSR